MAAAGKASSSRWGETLAASVWIAYFLTSRHARETFIAQAMASSNNGLQLTTSARGAPHATTEGQSLRAALAAEPECWAGNWVNDQWTA